MTDEPKHPGTPGGEKPPSDSQGAPQPGETVKQAAMRRAREAANKQRLAQQAEAKADEAVPTVPDSKAAPAARPLWHKWPGESAKQYSWFLRYLQMGDLRSVQAAYHKSRCRVKTLYTPCPGRWRVAAREFDWKGRAAAYDECMREVELDEIEKVRRAWIRRQFEISQKAAKKAEEMLGAAVPFKLRKMKMPDGTEQEMYVPDGWDFNDAMALAEKAMQAGRQALGLEVNADVIVENRGPGPIDEVRKLIDEARVPRPAPESCADDVKREYEDKGLKQ